MTRWIILRTSGGQTLPLAASLRAAGFDVWTPARTIRKVLRPGKRTEQRIEVEVPILPSYVFARETDIAALATTARAMPSPFPTFSLFQHDGRIPLVGDGQVQGLRDEEAKHAVKHAADTRAEAERIRIAALRTENARRRATWAMDRERIALGANVVVKEMPALVGVQGVVEATSRASASVRIGSMLWKIDAWRLAPADV